ncbi:MAG: DEAD/DEAH box helicase family protein [Tannerellaceae bacterium]|nr:DEAD/DEAH box helicase family protein [Tannerellaceae bacterium]
MVKTLRYSAEYASEVMDEIPPGYIDKTVCGCGLTSVALENDVHTIIAVPTIYLAENKAAQYPNARYNGKVLAVWGETKEDEIYAYRWFDRPRRLKIIVTYDSLPKVKDILDRFKCKLIIDESDKLLSQTNLKPHVIDEVFKIAEENKDTVSFISATPTPLEYMPPWISEIDQVKIEWENTMKAQPMIAERTFPYHSLRKEFILPFKEKGSMTLEGKTFRKLIVFLNSLRQIANIVREAALNKDECGIICGNSLTNDSKIAGIQRYIAGEMPKFLFITSSGFSGIDLYDSEAMTIVVSNTKRSWQMIDMLTDLKQAISRQRNKDNPNYGTFIYIFNQSIFKKSEEELLAQIDAVRKQISQSINLYDYGIQSGNENGFVPYPDFEAYTIFQGDKYVINEQAFLADKYFILEVRKQYEKGFDINGQFDDATEIKPIILPGIVTYSELVDYFKNKHQNGNVDWGGYETRVEWISVIEKCYSYYHKVWKDYTYAQMMIGNFGYTADQIKIKADKIFQEGRYTRKKAKEILQQIYDELNISRKAKHYDFDEIFNEVKHPASKGIRYVEIVEK